MNGQTGIDLFAGAGGSTLGLKKAGVEVRLAIEADRDAAATYSANFPKVELLPELIEANTPADIRRRAKLGATRLTILSACPPCQGFSTLGVCDSNDRRNDYVSTVGAFAAELQPEALILENVPGIEHDARCAALKNILSDLGYGVGSWILDASAFCVPQRRRRFVLLAVHGLLDDEVTDPRKSYRCTRRSQHPHTVRDVLEFVGPLKADDPLHRLRDMGNDTLERIRAIPDDGGSRWDLPEALQLPCHQRLTTRSAGNIYGRMRWDDKAPTMTTRCTTPSCGRFLHPSEDRPITLREAAAFQTFPRTHKWNGGVMSVARQIGNAVPVRLAYFLTKHALRLIAQAQEREIPA